MVFVDLRTRIGSSCRPAGDRLAGQRRDELGAGRAYQSALESNREFALASRDQFSRKLQWTEVGWLVGRSTSGCNCERAGQTQTKATDWIG